MPPAVIAPNFLYHAAPLHYVPAIVAEGALYARSVLAGRGIIPRVTRDHRLGLADFVHFSLTSKTPLLADKLAKGYPHAIFVFDAARIFSQPGVALLPYNTKAWRHRSAYAPVTDADAQAALFRSYGAGRVPSLEVLIPYGLSLDGLTRLAFLNLSECESVAAVLAAARLSAPLAADPSRFPVCRNYVPTTGGALSSYFSDCVAASKILPPPEIAFD